MARVEEPQIEVVGVFVVIGNPDNVARNPAEDSRAHMAPRRCQGMAIAEDAAERQQALEIAHHLECAPAVGLGQLRRIQAHECRQALRAVHDDGGPRRAAAEAPLSGAWHLDGERRSVGRQSPGQPFLGKPRERAQLLVCQHVIV